MKVIGAGFGRTGTMSLKGALEQLGFGPSFHMIDLARQPELLPGWQAAVDGENVDWEQLLEGWESTVDWPACTYWEQIWETFPDAKVLLSVREPESWYASCLKSIHASAKAAGRGELEGGAVAVSPEAMKLINGLMWNGTFDGRFEDKEFAIDVFNRHNEDVRARCPPTSCSSTRSSRAGSRSASSSRFRCRTPTCRTSTTRRRSGRWSGCRR